MPRDRKILYNVSALLLAVLLIAMFIPVASNKIFAACLVAPLALAVWLICRKRQALSINKREILLLSLIIGSIYVILIRFTGISFGFYKNPYFVSTEVFIGDIFPLTVLIICTEIIRGVLLAQKDKAVNAISFLFCVFAEVLAFSGFRGIDNYHGFMNMIGFALFPAVSGNIYYQYASKRYGSLPNIALRMITTLYSYFFTSTVDISNALHSFIKTIFPVLMLVLVAALYEKKSRQSKRQKMSKLSVALTAILFAILVSMVMLVSCQFRFGALVIGSDSMTGEINKGDVVLYKRYDEENIKEGQVIIFTQHENKIVHRVVKIENIAGELRYYTKGDANETLDDGYRTKADIVGLTDMKIAYAGYPTLWLRELLDSSN